MAPGAPTSPGQRLELQLLLEAIYARYHHDFRGYASGSLLRRIGRALDVLGCKTVPSLRELIVHQEEAFARLLPFLTVPVSDMFRDPPYFRFLREQVVPVLRTYPSLKIWVAGCSAGEEVYSFAILLREEGLSERALIYATDISPDSLRRAQAGVYDIDRLAQFSRNHQEAGGRRALSEYFVAAYGGAIFDKELRRRVVFSDHSLATDSAFAEVQLVSCRNVLIYFERPLQDRAVGLFRESLCHGGFLGLGSKESLLFSAHVGAFRELKAGARVYQRTDA
ncbi:MAG TPA: protein-glutamate O-methyltransferase CheR [Polyangia bacterium]|nr:protein-glutamate O-methyltransferase CheR [Polyangia bacterium]